jgi:hypothetical protein
LKHTSPIELRELQHRLTNYAGIKYTSISRRALILSDVPAAFSS